MTPEELDELRCFYAYRQKAYLRSLLVEELKVVRWRLESARTAYNLHPTPRHARYIKYREADMKRIEERIKELDSMGVMKYVKRNQHPK